MLPRIISATGSSISADEIAAVQRVICTRTNQHAGIYRILDQLTGVLVEYHPYKNTAYTTPGGATDYVAMSMPNPVPYRGVSIGVVTGAIVSRQITGGQGANWDILVAGVVYSSQVGSLTGDSQGFNYWNNFLADVLGAWPGYVANGKTGGGGIEPVSITYYPDTSGTMVLTPWQLTSAGAAAVIYANTLSQTKTYVMASDGEVLASEAMTVPISGPDNGAQLYSGGEFYKGDDFAGYPVDVNRHCIYDMLRTAWFFPTTLGIPLYGTTVKPTHPTWSASPIWMFKYAFDVTATYDHKLIWGVPEDCIYPLPASDTPMYPGTDVQYIDEWISDWSAGVTAFNARRKAWLKKNSDEFIAALKTGFASTSGVSRAELKTGNIPSAWGYKIKTDVDVKYNSYAPTSTIGRKTHRGVLYSETAFSETIESDTSAELTQAGVKRTKRTATLSYNITVNGVVEIRSVDITGYLTQTVTQHLPNYDLSQKDVYDTWYNREATTLPYGIPSTITAPYLKDRTTSRIGVVLNGTVQYGYNADSTLGTIGNPLTYALYVPPYPKASSTVAATVPEFIQTWHKDAKITYDKAGVDASNAENDSAMYGVTRVEITPIGAYLSESLGMFPDATTAQDATQVELFGTAVYNFDWQTGVLTFHTWKPLHDANGVELASKIIALPAATVWSDYGNNCLVKYSPLHWPDVVAAIKARDKGLPTTTVDNDKALYTLIQAIKAG